MRLVIVAMETCVGSQISAAVAELGYEALQVCTVSEAVAAVEREKGRIAAIFCRVALADGNWCDLVESLKRWACSTPVVLCIRDGCAETWWDALEGGVQEVMVPPFTARAIERVIAACHKGTS